MEQVSVAEGAEVQTVVYDRQTAGDGVCQSSHEGHGAEGDDERGEIAVGDQESVDQADERTDHHAEKDGEQGVEPLLGGQNGDATADGDGRTNGQIDAGGNDDECHARGKNRADGDGPRHVEQVAHRAEVRGLDQHEYDQHQQYERHADLLPGRRQVHLFLFFHWKLLFIVALRRAFRNPRIAPSARPLRTP